MKMYRLYTFHLVNLIGLFYKFKIESTATSAPYHLAMEI